MKQVSRFNSATIDRLPRYAALLIGFGAAGLFFIMGVMAILRSTSSTAALGFLVVPVFALFFLIAFSILGYLVGVVLQGLLVSEYRYRPRFFLSFLIVVPVMIYMSMYGAEVFNTYRRLDQIYQMNTHQLNVAFYTRPTHSYFGYDIFILDAIANHRSASAEVLDNIAHLNDPRLNESVGSIFGLSKGNGKGLAPIRLVALNPNVSVVTLRYLMSSDNYYLLGDMARSGKLSVEDLRKLYAKSQGQQEGYLIEWGLAYNPNTPPDILRELAKKIKYGSYFDVINSALKNNPSTPEDVRAKLF